MTLSVADHKARKPSHEQASLIKEELCVILASESFSSSARCRDFLQFVVERTLSGDYDSLTERFLGVHLFGRAVDYETATDSIVRVRANDVRRRLAQHYSRALSPSTTRIDLIAGGYIPEFYWGKDPGESSVASDSISSQSLQSAIVVDEPATPSVTTDTAAGQARSWGHKRLWLGSGIGLAMLALVILGLHLHTRDRNFTLFWQPVQEASLAPVISLPTTETLQLSMTSQQLMSQLKKGDTINVPSSDLETYHNWHVSLPVFQAALSVSLALEREGKTPLVRVGTDLSRDELRGHPIIAIGSFSNPWTKQNVSGLRFTFDRGTSDQEQPRIRDAFNPQRSWSLSKIYPGVQTKDYAIVTRTFDPVTREPFISLAGLHSFGNQIAGEFVSQDSSWNEVASRAPRDWEQINLQIVLETEIVGTTPSSPKIVDVYFWK